jgi:hypothetical protein
MTRDVKKRLRNLESRMPRRPTQRDEYGEAFSRLFRLAIAQHFGNPLPGESLAEPYARALGYRDGYEFRIALESKIAGKFTDLDERQALANRKLLAKFGATPNNLTGETRRQMKESLSEYYKQRFLAPVREPEVITSLGEP